jgi:sulfite reductase alpha subunit-like flavoprotein
MAPLRILLVFGSESGTAERGIATLAKQWTKSGDAAKFKIVGNVSGNSVTSLESLKERCDVLIISTSSFGEGDPPANYSNFLLKLYRAEKAGEMPLKGLQHAVLGYGCSVCARLLKRGDGAM